MMDNFYKVIKQIIVENSGEKALTKPEIILFKYLNKKKEGLNKKELIELIMSTLKGMGLQENEALYYYNIYVNNYRKDGDYENITKDEFFGPEKQKQQRTTNVGAHQLVASKMPFKGSNLEGSWDTDSKNVPYYLVVSYGWYPVYLFKDGTWYEQLNRYSNATSKQMSQASPFRYNSRLNSEVILVTRDEMEKLRSFATKDDIIKGKAKSAQEKKDEIIHPKMKTALGGWRGDYWGKVKYKISDIETEDDKIIVKIDVADAGKVKGQSMEPSKGGYLKGELEGVTKEKVEDLIIDKISESLRKYSVNLGGKSNIEYKFNHLMGKND